MEHLPPIWIINLPRSADRRKKMASHMEALGLPYEFVPGVDGLTLTAADISRYSKVLALRTVKRELIPNEIGCAIAHSRLYERIVREKIDEVLVLEDDVQLTAQFLEILAHRGDFRVRWDVVNFSTNWKNDFVAAATPLPGHYRLFKVRGTAAGARCYLITYRGARTALSNIFPIRAPADDALYRSDVGRLAAYCVMPSPVIMTDAPSTIGVGIRGQAEQLKRVDSHVQVKLRRFARWLGELPSALCQTSVRVASDLSEYPRRLPSAYWLVGQAKAFLESRTHSRRKRRVLKIAARAFRVGHLATSESASRHVLDRDPLNSTALNMLGLIAIKVGELDHARSYFETALRCSPANKELRHNLVRLSQIPETRDRKGQSERFLLIRSWGAGFWSDVSHVLGALLLAEMTGRIPVTHWGRSSLYSVDASQDAFRNFFEPVSDVGLEDLAGIKSPTCFPPKWNKENLADDDPDRFETGRFRAAPIYLLNRPETIIVCDEYAGVISVAPWLPRSHPMYKKPLDEIFRYLIEKYLRPRREISSRCEAFFQAHLDRGPFAAIHLRGSDKFKEDHELNAVNEYLLSKLTSIDPAWPIFLLSDDEQWPERASSVYGDRIIATSCQRTNSAIGVHNLPSTDRTQAGIEVLIDTLLGLRANRFFGNGRSNVSAFVAVMKKWRPGECTLVGRSVLWDRPPSLDEKNSR